MKRLFITHEWSELVMAWVDANLCVLFLWVTFNPDVPFVGRYAAGNGALITVMLTYAALFTMGGSRKRAEAAARQPEPAEG